MNYQPFGAEPPAEKVPWWDKFGTLGDTLGGFTVFITAIAGLFFIVRDCKVRRKRK